MAQFLHHPVQLFGRQLTDLEVVLGRRQTVFEQTMVLKSSVMLSRQQVLLLMTTTVSQQSVFERMLKPAVFWQVPKPSLLTLSAVVLHQLKPQMVTMLVTLLM